MGFISDLLTNISAFRIKVGEKLNWLNANKADTTALADFVKKDGSVAMTGSLPMTSVYLEPNIRRQFTTLGLAREIITAYSGSSSFSIGAVNNDNDEVSYYYIGSNWSTRVIQFNNDGTIMCSPATANNHAVTLGQVNGFLSEKVTNFEKAQGIGFLNGNVNEAPYFYHDSGTYVFLATQTYVNGQFSNYALLSQVYTQSQALSLFVGLNGVQTIADTKTFTSSPIVPNGTLSGHTVNLGQVTTLLNDKADKVAGKQLSTEDYTSAEKIKLTGIAPDPHSYQNITTNGIAIDASQFRRVVAVFSDPSVGTASLSNAAYPGTVVTLQTTSVQVDVTMDYRRLGSSGPTLPIEAYTSVQVSFSEDQSAWIVEQINSLS